MIEITTLGAHDPLPEGHSVVLMRRFAEDAPDRAMVELIVAAPDGGSRTEVPTGPDGMPLDWEASLEVAREAARGEGLDRVHAVDRLSGSIEREVIAHGGNRTLPDRALEDRDSEASPGADMRAHEMREAPRRF